jgi:non-ribosomal peptide synthetase component F
MATLVKAAWAIMLAKMCGTQDVIFLHLVHGRAEEYTGSADIIGCCATEIPVRVRFGLQGVVSSFQLLSLIQRQLLQSSPHAHLGSHHIAADCTNWPKKDQFYRHSTFVQHQNIDEPTSFPFGEDAQCDITYRTPESGIYDFTLVSRPSDGGMSFELKAAGDLYTQAEVDQVADAVRSLIIDLNCETDKPLDELYCDDLSLPGANQN